MAKKLSLEDLVTEMVNTALPSSSSVERVALVNKIIEDCKDELERSRYRDVIEEYLYDFRERTCLWDESDGTTESLASTITGLILTQLDEDRREALSALSDAQERVVGLEENALLIDEALRAAGNEYPLGFRGVKDVIMQRAGHRARAEEAEIALDDAKNFLNTLTRLDDAEGPGKEMRKTITLTEIIRQAQALLDEL